MLRGDRCVPVVELSSKPMPTKYKMSARPHFKIVGWKILGGEIPASTTVPQLEAPKPKSSAALADETLAAMDDAKEPTVEEILDDEIKF